MKLSGKLVGTGLVISSGVTAGVLSSEFIDDSSAEVRISKAGFKILATSGKVDDENWRTLAREHGTAEANLDSKVAELKEYCKKNLVAGNPTWFLSSEYEKVIKSCTKITSFKEKAEDYLGIKTVDLSVVKNVIKKWKEVEDEFKSMENSKLRTLLSSTSESTFSPDIISFCLNAKNLKWSDYKSSKDVENDWAKYLKICTHNNEENLSFWYGK